MNDGNTEERNIPGELFSTSDTTFVPEQTTWSFRLHNAWLDARIGFFADLHTWSQSWLFRVFSGCPVDPCAIMQFLWDRYRPLRSSLAADRAPASHKSLITFMLA